MCPFESSFFTLLNTVVHISVWVSLTVNRAGLGVKLPKQNWYCLIVVVALLIGISSNIQASKNGLFRKKDHMLTLLRIFLIYNMSLFDRILFPSGVENNIICLLSIE